MCFLGDKGSGRLIYCDVIGTKGGKECDGLRSCGVIYGNGGGMLIDCDVIGKKGDGCVVMLYGAKLMEG